MVSLDSRVTTKIRYALDELLPPLVREWRPLMYPLFRLWFGSATAARLFMDFKRDAFTMTEAEYCDAYRRHRTLGGGRATDAFEETLDWIVARIDSKATSLLDVGCGSGYWLRHLSGEGLRLAGCDIAPSVDMPQGVAYHQGTIEQLPFSDGAFDVVTCLFVLEHVRCLPAAIRELKRVARRQLIAAVPVQRYYDLTFDPHLHFFYSEGQFASFFELPRSQSATIGHGKTGQIVASFMMD